MFTLDHCDLTPDKFGYYLVGNAKTYSKLEALEIQKVTGDFPQWNFNNEIYQIQDWTQEPSTTLWELYKQRAVQIRNSYDYVVLFYSGGSDSQNMLSAWMASGLKIDEIATQWNVAGTGSRSTFWNGEVDRVALPWIQQLKNQGLEFNFRLLDISADTQNVIEFHAHDYAYHANTNLSPNNYAKNMWRHQITEYKQIIESGKKLCFVWGSEKPFLLWDGRHYCVFQDIIDNCVNPYTQRQYHQGWYDELFYWAPELPQIVIKQVHVLKNFCQTNLDPANFQDTFTRHGYNPHIKKWLREDVVKTLLYPYWDTSTYVDGKPPSMVLSWRDNWLFASTQGQQYRDYLQSLKQQLDLTWLNDVDHISKGLKNCISPHYYLEEKK
jgi:hypothetical protein